MKLFQKQNVNKNIDLNKIHVGSHKALWWKCTEGHEWKTSVKSLTALGTRCSKCLRKKVIEFFPNFQSKYPNLATMWDTDKNLKPLENEMQSTTSAYFYFQCKNNHQFKIYTPLLDEGAFDGCDECEKNNEQVAWEAFINALELEQQFSEKNGKLNLKKLSKGSNVKVLWNCEYDHEWERSCKAIFRDKSNKCPTCTGYNLSNKYNWLAHNELAAKEWLYEKNTNINPAEEFPNSHTKAYFKCAYGHTWRTSLKRRTEGHGCPKCSNQTSRPELRIFSELKLIFPEIKHRHRLKKQEADIFLPKQMVVIEFDGGYYHKNKLLKDREKKRNFEHAGFSVINIRQNLEALDHNSICIPDRELTKGDLNLIVTQLIKHISAPDLAQALIKYSKRKRFWNDEFYRTCVSALPAPLIENSLQVRAPDLAKEWDIKLNYPLTPKHFTSRSSTRVHWKCQSNHKWQARIAARVGSKKQKGTSCPYCVGRLPTQENNFEVQFPTLLKEWDYVKNTKGPHEYNAFSGKKVWWNCEKCHFNFEQIINSRSLSGSGCPKCANKNKGEKSKIPISISHPSVFSLINAQETGFDVSGLTKGSGKEVVFICKCSHYFRRRIIGATKQNSRCPNCKALLNNPNPGE